MSRFSLLLEGKDETVAKIELPEVEHLYKANYVPTNCVLMLSGDVARSDSGIVQNILMEWKGTKAILFSIPEIPSNFLEIRYG
jgi:predicted Zn-dependent peptidase